MISIDSLLYISWDVSPNLYEGFITLRYYSLFFALSFILGFIIVKKIYLKEGAPIEWMDKLLVYAVFGTIIGARLGHVLFYEPAYYLKNPLEIFMVWKGGLASHGAAIALVVAMYLYSRKITKKHIFWSLDKLVIAVALAAGFIRMGNLMNSEIIGEKTESKYGIFYEFLSKQKLGIDGIEFENTGKSEMIDNFNYPICNINFPSNIDLSLYSVRSYIDTIHGKFNFENINSESYFFTDSLTLKNWEITNNKLSIPVYIIPRAPTQVLEALSYWFIFIILFLGHWKWNWDLYQGRLFGVFLVMLFSARFFIEFLKEHQTIDDMSVLNMGQWLSIPCILIGGFFIFKAKKI
ncbi:MAG: diacylglyceryl transferase [Crocinitomicaceae bacterium]|nr:diacylglyceryl transferase [Crocinitomicaceae bacterium]|tara:strand:+ start:754 stop:1803 length:1050 start_codon:yes stop_codon:yes gene_type:complete